MLESFVLYTHALIITTLIDKHFIHHVSNVINHIHVIGEILSIRSTTAHLSDKK